MGLWLSSLALPQQLKICEILDKDGIANVIDVARHCNLSADEIIKLEQHAAGGGNPALSFYETLATENYEDSLSDLCDCLKELRIMKAANVLKDYEAGKKIGDIMPLDLDKLSTTSTVGTKCKANNWRHVAQHYKKDPDRFETAIRQGYSYSRTNALFKIIGSKYLKEINIGKFLDCVSGAGNKEAEIEIQNQINELAKEMI